MDGPAGRARRCPPSSTWHAPHHRRARLSTASGKTLSMLETALIILVVAIVFTVQAVKVVPQQSAWVLERLGKYHGTLTAGLNIVLPFIDRVSYKHSLKEVPLDVPSQVCITKDNTQLQVDGILYFQVTDAMRASYGT